MIRSSICGIFGLLMLFGSGPSPAEASDRTTEVLARTGDTSICEEAPGLAGWLLGGSEVWSLERVLEARQNKPKVKAIVVGFFATWCEPCKVGLKLLQREALKAARSDVVFVLVAIPPFDTSVENYLKGLDVTLPTVKDKYGAIWERWTRSDSATGASSNLPRTVIIDAGQSLVAVFGAEGSDYASLVARALDDPSHRCRTNASNKAPE